MNTENSKKRFTLSIGISIVIHILVLLYIIYYIAVNPLKPSPAVIQANLVDLSSAASMQMGETASEESASNTNQSKISQSQSIPSTQVKSSAQQSKKSSTHMTSSKMRTKSNPNKTTQTIQTTSLVKSISVLSSQKSTRNTASVNEPSLSSLMSSNVNQAALKDMNNSYGNGANPSGKESNNQTAYKIKVGGLLSKGSSDKLSTSNIGNGGGNLVASSSSGSKGFGTDGSGNGPGISSVGSQIGGVGSSNGMDMKVIGGGSAIWDPNNRLPSYPSDAEKNHWQGSVILVMNVNEKGQVTSVVASNRSGYSSLDSAAMNAATSWKIFVVKNGSYVPGRVQITIRFKLKN